MFMAYSIGMRVKDINPDRAADRAADSTLGVGTVTDVQWEDECSPTVYVQWDGASDSDVHGVQDIAPDMSEHTDYPHEPGRLYDCPACESQCYCGDVPGAAPCVHCAESGNVEFFDYDPTA